MPIPSVLPASTGNAATDAYTKASLDAMSAGVDYTQSPTYKTLLSLIGPGPDGGLNPALAAQYKSGSGIIAAKGQQDVASSLSRTQGRGLAGSSIEAQGVENANFNTSMSESALLGSLYGEQNQNSTELARDVVSGSSSELGSLLSIYENAGTSAANIQMYSDSLREALAAAHDSAGAARDAGMWQGGGALLGGFLGGL